MKNNLKLLLPAKEWLILCVPVLLFFLYMSTHPFSDRLVARTVSTRDLSTNQRMNIRTAVRALNGTVINPGEEFSFNDIVGPRTLGRGYMPAPSYLGRESPTTMGGGICLVSSLVYQVALEAGLEISERVPHLRTIKTVPPGLDATVWYDRADLCFRNTLPYPVAILGRANAGNLRVELAGKSGNRKSASIRRLITHRAADRFVVEVFRRQGANEKRVSRDLYRLTP